MSSDKKETIKIYLRIRPARDPSKNYVIERDFDSAKVKFHLDKNVHSEVVNNQIEDYAFQFTDVFDRETTQTQIFDRVAKGCVESVLQGYNSTIFAYGQTGSGKTFSITGGSESYEQRGIIPRAISMIFDAVGKDQSVNTEIRVSYMQIYSDKGQDLLNKGEDAKCLEDLPKVTVAEGDEEFIVKGLGLHKCDKQEDALNLLFLGDTNRMYCETSMNNSSSRSHCIFTIMVQQQSPGSAVVRRSKLHLVDLAGSERVKKTGAEGKLLQEARFINLSLHFLQEVITALCDKAEGKRDHIPYRQSLMTMVLRDSLGGNCKTVMLATAHPQDLWMDETISTCKFSQRVASIKINARVNEETDPTLLVKKLRSEISALKEELAMFRKGDQAGDRILSTDEKERCKEALNRYLKSDNPDENMTGLEGDLARIFFCFSVLKDTLNSKGITQTQTPIVQSVGTPTTNPSTPDVEINNQSGGGGGTSKQLHQLQLQLQQKDNEINMLLGIVQKYQRRKRTLATQTGVDDCNISSQAPDQQRIPTPPTENMSRADQHHQVKMASVQHKLATDYNLESLDTHGLELFKDTAAAFEQFRRSWRKFEQIERQKDEQRTRCDRARQLASTINTHSVKIAATKNKIEQLIAERATQGWDEPHPEEKQLFATLDREKSAYRKLVAELSEEKKVYEHFQNILRGVSAKLTADFESWWSLRKWQLTGAQGRSDSLVAFSDKKFTERTNEPGRPVLSKPDNISSAKTYPAPQQTVPRGAAPDHEVQSELQKLFQARDRLKSMGNTREGLPG